LIANDKRFRDLKQGTAAYAEAWALTYFLLRQHPKEYVDYLRMLSLKKPLVQDGADRRVEQFEKYFGPLKKLEPEFTRFMTRLR
jgi:hypothetical protein